MRHERKTIRLKDYDYSRNGFYFVTICTKDRIEQFGEIKNEAMIISDFGEIVKQQWLWLKEQYSYVGIDEYIVMPNHFHGILLIDSEEVGNGRDRSLQDNPAQKVKPLPELIGAFKTTSSKLIHESGLSIFKWQKSFHDHIIRNDKSLDRIRKYIHYNPLKWEYDQENKNDILLEQKKKFWKEFLR